MSASAATPTTTTEVNTAPAPVVAAAPTTTTPPVVPATFHSASLYVGDLSLDVNEGLLFEIFNAVGPVASIRVCRDAVTRRSLGYAYVNFHQVTDAERALDTMNYTVIKAKPCRIMWSQRDPSLRKSGVGNIFVKNLNESIDNKQLYDTFSLFGNILSCKVVSDPDSDSSKGYGYVHYENAQSSNDAIEKLDGMLIEGLEVQVINFMRRNERPDQSSWTNVYVKNVPAHWEDGMLEKVFAEFGEVVSATVARGVPKFRKPKVAKGVDGEESEKEEEEEEPEPVAPSGVEAEEQSLGYGFVSYLNHDDAVVAVENLNGKAFDVENPKEGEPLTQELFVGRAQKKQERERELRSKFEQIKVDRISKFQGVNLYVKNLDDMVTDDQLREEFSSIGTITSARVMREVKDGASRGFGFVCYSSSEEGTKAVNEMNGRIVNGKPIFVALAQRKDVRRAQLEAQHVIQRVGGGLGAQGGNNLGNSLMPGASQQQRLANANALSAQMGGQVPYGMGGMPYMLQSPRGVLMSGQGGAYPGMQNMQGLGIMGGPRGALGPRGYPVAMGGRGYPQVMQGQYPQGLGGRGVQAGRIPGGRGGAQGRGGPRGVAIGGRGAPQPRGAQSFHLKQNVRNAPMLSPSGLPLPQQMSQQMNPPGSDPLTPAALAAASPDMQKNMIGERLYPLIHQSQPELAGKITGMLLEMDNGELLHLLESPEALKSKIMEALQVLEAHSSSIQE